MNLWAYHQFKPIAPPRDPALTSKDVTVIVPSHKLPRHLGSTLQSVVDNRPRQLILATTEENKAAAERIAKQYTRAQTELQVVAVKRASKRRQLIEGIKNVTTAVTVLADDDVIWGPSLLRWILAPFSRERIGGVATCQRLIREPGGSCIQKLWGFLGALYLERRNFDCTATAYIDGGTACLSGRTVAYRTEILADPALQAEFETETWRGHEVRSDDDNFLTRWLVSHGWGMYFQNHQEALVVTTLEDNSRFLKQCVRWCRSNWRSNWRSLFCEKHIWRKHPYSTYAVYLTTLFPPVACVTDGMLVWLCHKATKADRASNRRLLTLLLLWMFITKCVKFLGYFQRNPIDTFLLPLSVLFGYAHGAIKLYALCTLHVTTWEDRAEHPTRTSWRELRTFFWEYGWPAGDRKLQLRLVGAVLCLLVLRGLNMLMPLQIRWAMDTSGQPRGECPKPPAAASIRSQNIDITWQMLALLFSQLFDINQLFVSLRSSLLLPLEKMWSRRLREDAFSKIMKLPSNFHDSRNPGSLLDMISETRSFENVVTMTLFVSIPTFLDTLLALVSICWQLGPREAVSFSAVMAGYVMVARKLHSRRGKQWAEYRNRIARERELRQDVIFNRLISVRFNRVDNEIAHHGALVNASLNAEPGYSSPFETLVVFAAGLVLCVVTTRRAGAMALMVAHLVLLRRPLEILLSIMDGVNQELARLEPLITLFNMSTADQPRILPGIVFDRVTFSYGSNNILNELSFTVPSGKTVAIVGASGTGKSTICDLLSRDRSPDSGVIRIDGKDLSDINGNRIAYASQKPEFLRRSILANLQYGQPGEDETVVQEICRAVGIHDRILQCSEGYRTQYEPHLFSGGELQLLNTARALIRKSARIALFDEPTNNLDSTSSTRVLDAINAYGVTRTCIIISHKLRDIQHIDHILVLQKGKIAETGNFSQLIAKRGIFYDFYLAGTGGSTKAK
ncbi:hypothetical protein LOZ66_006838 [Ophidiomyces ophidiicola]|nr:hypothetical protein LOZ66_006838 [Ophidiomyces ophidiicola]